MQLLSIISDYGSKDYYLAELKAAIFNKCGHLPIIDISHDIEVYDISLAAYHLKYMMPSLPDNSINLISVNNYYTKNPKYLIFFHQNKYFIGPDNGVFSLLFEDLPQVYEIDLAHILNKQVQSVYSHAIACIHFKLPFEEFTQPIDQVNEKLSFRPVVTKDQIKATIIHVDKYENVITNCTRAIFDKHCNGRSFAIYYKPHDPLEKISKHYGEVQSGDTLVWFNTADHLEIAVNMGKASSSLHLYQNETIQIDFQ